MKEKNYKATKQVELAHCYHCGDVCRIKPVVFDDKKFCCDGCKLVYDLLRENNLCTYYNINANPGITQAKQSANGQFDYLDYAEVSNKLIRFSDAETVHVTFFVPGIHCSSCIWLLENLHRINPAIRSSTVNFMRKEADIIFDPRSLQLSQVADLLAHIGYAPLVSLEDLEKKVHKTGNKKEIIKIGLAGFCFGNIMMLSFPEYFSSGNFQDQKHLSTFFGYLNLTLSMPVFFYCASSFFVSAWKSIRHKFLNIDAPIALAILVTFIRSAYEIITNTGTGYMDSMSGIVFFMLLGRFFQNQTYEALSFDRNYKSYFPVGVTVKNQDGSERNKPVTDLKKGDHIIIRNNELIPADALLVNESTHIDYSFITGESVPVKRLTGELIYAGGRQLDGAIHLEIINPVMQSYLTKIWNKSAEQKKEKETGNYIDRINKYFTIVVLSIAFISGAYWSAYDIKTAMNVFTAVLIVACPCGLLLTSTFAHGSVMRIFGRNKFYLKNAGVIHKMTQADTVLFDKTGTITHGSEVVFIGKQLTTYDETLAVSLASNSSHPLSRKICENFGIGKILQLTHFRQFDGNGIKGVVDQHFVILGSSYFVTGKSAIGDMAGKVFLSIDGQVKGFFGFANAYRPGLKKLFQTLETNYTIKLLSGDNDAERNRVKEIAGEQTDLLFNLKPEDKLQHIVTLQNTGKKTIMIGDGLNDAVALQQSNIGIAVSDDTNTFSPAADAIIDGQMLTSLPAFLKLAKSCQKIIISTFIFSLFYNVCGLVFAVSGTLLPVVAAVLMPLSSITIVAMVTLLTGFSARRNGL
jgi:Cu+-exporting ATPase